MNFEDTRRYEDNYAKKYERSYAKSEMAFSEIEDEALMEAPYEENYQPTTVDISEVSVNFELNPTTL